MANCELCNAQIRSSETLDIYGFKSCFDCVSRCRKIEYFKDINSFEEYEREEQKFIDKSTNKELAESFLKARKGSALKHFFTDEQIEERDFNRRQNTIETEIRGRGLDGYYEYTAVSLVDEDGGFMETEKITAMLNELGIHGWRLVAAYSNELGHNSSSAGLFGISAGTNATIDQNVLILERFVKI